MEVLFHFFFEVFKIAVLALFYATALLLVCGGIAILKPGSRIDQLSEDKSMFWFFRLFWKVVLLFLFMFTVWGNHGLGDNYAMPVGGGKAVKAINSLADPYIEDASGTQLSLGNFKIERGKLWGELSEGDRRGGIYGFVVWDLSRETWKTYEEWEALQKENADAPADQKLFRSYEDSYMEYWNGWRFWLLP